MGQQFVSSILFLQLTEGVDAFVLWCYTSTAWRDASSFWGQGVWSVGKRDEDYLRVKGRCYWNDNLDDTEIVFFVRQCSISDYSTICNDFYSFFASLFQSRGLNKKDWTLKQAVVSPDLEDYQHGEEKLYGL